jgi:cysteine-rich repeat protein
MVMTRKETEMQHSSIGRFAFATLIVVLGTPQLAAAVDLSGEYVVSDPVPCRLTLVQTGTALETSGFCSLGDLIYPVSSTGTVDPATGAFSGAGAIPGLCVDLFCSGTGDGEETHSTCTSSTSVCNNITISATKCGNGAIDPLEDCEDGNHADGDCCSARCRLDAAGSACTSDSIDCTDDVCNATGTCMHEPTVGACDDGNACTIGEMCVDGACVAAEPAPAGQACSDDLDPCTADVCDGAGTCTHEPLPPKDCRQALVSRDVARCMATQCTGVDRTTCRRRCKPAAIRTLAYVVSECREDTAGMVVGRQALRIRRGEREPISVMDFARSEPIPDPTRQCFNWRGGSRFGARSVSMFPLQRLGVSPDGSGVVFEVNQEFSVLPLANQLLPEQQGFFFVRADGQGLRYLGPPSHEPSFGGVGFALSPPIAFSPSGRRIVFTDRVEGAPQIIVLDLAKNVRRQATHLPSGTPPSTFFGPFLLTCCPAFIDDETIRFHTYVDPDGSNPEHDLAAFTVRIDGSRLERIPPPVAAAGSEVVPNFGVAGRRTSLVRLTMPGDPVSNPVPPGCGPGPLPCADFRITEIFLQDAQNLVQLTKLNSADTFAGFVNPTGTRAFFMTSVDPLGMNPHGNCQLFSVNSHGRGLRQVTHFDQGGSPPPVPGCFGASLPACSLGEGYYRVVFQDPVTKAIVFISSCDPLGTNNGNQIFAMRADGSGLRQLTDAAGVTTDRDGNRVAELVGPFAYSAEFH